jgi:hypothetical protein
MGRGAEREARQALQALPARGDHRLAPQARAAAIARAGLLALAFAALAGCAGPSEFFRDAGSPPPPAPRALADWPYRETWTGVVFNGARIGFTRLAIAPAADAPGRWDIESEAALRLRFLGIDKRVNLHARDRVRADLTLERFAYAYQLDGSPLHVSGQSDGKHVDLRIEATGTRDEKRLPLSAPLYAQSTLSMLPVMRGLAVGRKDRALVLQGETQALAVAEQETLAYERSDLFDGPAFKVETRLLGLATSAWIAPDGRPLFELAMHGTMISALEPESEARRYLASAALNKDEAMLEFSLIRSPPLEAPRRVAQLEIALSGVPPELAVPSGPGQACSREGANLKCLVDRNSSDLRQQPGPAYLRPTLSVPSTSGEITALARSIAGEARDPDARIRRIVGWIESNIAREAIDVFTAADVLRERRAECQGHAYLFAALARALGIPARVVNGIVFSETHGGFLYHSWNEAWIEGEGWRAIDPTFAQPRADATHLKLLEGESPLELAPLVGMVGKAKVESLRALAHW